LEEANEGEDCRGKIARLRCYMPDSTFINHIAFGCRDLARQEKFYTKHFGFKRSRTMKRGTPGEFFMLKLGSIRLEFFPPNPDQPLSPEAKGGEAPVGYRHLAFDVPKLEPVIEALKADGVSVDPIIELGHLGPGFRIVFFRDPEGNILELMESYCDEE
jgi:glyoxylase I family protein